MGGKTTSTTESSIRYAPYIEAAHEDLLDKASSKTNTLINTSPYSTYTDLDFSDAFFGSGYVMSSFPSLYDMYGKFVAGLDVEVLFDQVLYDIQNADTIQDATEAHQALLNDTMEQNNIPRYEEGMRDINAVMTSSYTIGKAIIEQGAVKKVAEFDANLRYQLISVAAQAWSRHLDWNKDAIDQYLKIQTIVIDKTLAVQDKNYEYAVKDTMWPFTILDQYRACVGALQGATTSKTEAEESPLGMILSTVGLLGSLFL